MSDPHPAIVANDHGLKFYNAGKFAEAESSYRRAISLVPGGGYPEAWNNVGILFQTTGRTSDACAAYRQALKFSPDFPQSASNLGCIAEEVGKYDEAMKFYRFALAKNPKMCAIWHNLGGVYRELGRFDESYECYEKALELEPKNAVAHASLVYTKDSDPRTTREQAAAEKMRWHDAHKIDAPLPIITDPDPDRRLRVGYVSGDMRLHSMAFAFSDVIYGHDRNKFEVFVYSSTMREDLATERFRNSVDHWTRAVGMSDQALFEKIRADRIDILVDLSGYTAQNRLQLFTMRPAPVQLHAWGYMNGCGLPEIPYTLGDAVIDPVSPPDAQLPCVFHYHAPVAPDIAPLPARKNGHITFGYLGRWSKVTPEVAKVWHQVMAAIPSARIILKDKLFGDVKRQSEALAALDLPAHRVTFLPQTGHYDHLAHHGAVDIGLDPWITNGGVSTLEALWMGVPIITLPADRPSSRVGASVMTTLGLHGCVARDPDDYVLKAVALANTVKLGELRAGMRKRMQATVIGDAAKYVAHVERVYRNIWRKTCAQ